MKNSIFITILFFSFAIIEPLLAHDFTYSQKEYDDEFDEYEKQFSKKNGEEIYDPLEKMNRKIFAFNEALDIHLIEPVTKGYRGYVPKSVRNSVTNFITNLTLPLVAINSFAQGKVDNGLASLSNFLINTTIGVGGLFDVAGKKNIHYEKEDFGQTLGHYGVKSGAYLVLPILGPSSARDATGLAVDKSVDVLGFNMLAIGGERDSINNNYKYANAFLYGLDKRENLLDPIDDLRKDSFDLYATFRSAYLQQREYKVSH